MLDEAGIDSIEVSGNGTSVSGIKALANEGYFVPAASEIAKAVNLGAFSFVIPYSSATVIKLLRIKFTHVGISSRFTSRIILSSINPAFANLISYVSDSPHSSVHKALK
jgi:hypothetical protein